jgi:hypothetical protein
MWRVRKSGQDGLKHIFALQLETIDVTNKGPLGPHNRGLRREHLFMKIVTVFRGHVGAPLIVGRLRIRR